MKSILRPIGLALCSVLLFAGCTKTEPVSPILDRGVVQFESTAPAEIPDVKIQSDVPASLMRVRLFPLVSVPSYEPYPETVNFNEVQISNEGGLTVYAYDIAGNGNGKLKDAFARGTTVSFNFKTGEIFVVLDGTTSIFPLRTVMVRPDAGVESQSRVIWNKGLKEVNLLYRGDYVATQAMVPTLFTEQTTTVDQQGMQLRLVHEFWRDVRRWSVINHLDVDVYLCSVIPSEVYPSWPGPALEAQAIAARTYAVRQAVIARVIGRPWDVDPTTRFQSYRGAGLEKAPTSEAVLRTDGRIMTYKGTVIEASYSANSGGIVCASADCFNVAKPYLKSKLDVDGIRDVADGSGRWTATTKTPQIKALLKNSFGVDPSLFSKLVVGRIGEVVDGATAPKNRVWTLKAALKTGRQVEFTYSQTKSTFTKFRGALYTISEPAADGVQTVTGYGFGHGVGMSQWGAYIQAKAGKTAEEIVRYYYDDIELETLD